MEEKVIALIDRINRYTNYKQSQDHQREINLDKALNSALLRFRKQRLNREK
jgi:hypothetical protein